MLDAVEALQTLSRQAPDSPALQSLKNSLLAAQGRMSDEIARRYELQSAK